MEKYNKHIADNPRVEMIHISMDSNRKDATAWAEKESFPWLTILPKHRHKKGLMTLYTTGVVPTYILVNAAAEVLATDSEQAFTQIEELSKEAKTEELDKKE